MTSDVKMPEWAMEEARKLWVTLGFINDRLPAIARALLAAEQRGRKAGLEEAAKVATEYANNFAGSIPSDNAQQGTCHRIAAAIRSLGEKT